MFPFAVLCAVSIAACSERLGKMVLEFKDVQGFSVEEVRRDNPRALKLSGFAFHSSLAVDGIEKTIEGDQLRVRVFLTLVRPGKSGAFEFIVDVPKGVRYVVFGDERHVVWTAPGP